MYKEPHEYLNKYCMFFSREFFKAHFYLYIDKAVLVFHLITHTQVALSLSWTSKRNIYDRIPSPPLPILRKIFTTHESNDEYYPNPFLISFLSYYSM